MTKKWVKIYESQSSKQFTAPEGWDSQEVVASELQCPCNKVSEILSYAIKSGDILTKTFPIWDERTARVVRKTFYKENPAISGDVVISPDWAESEEEPEVELFTQQSDPIDDVSEVVDVFPHKVGCRVYSRWRCIEGTLQDSGEVHWDNGKVSLLTVSMIKKGDAKFIS